MAAICTSRPAGSAVGLAKVAFTIMAPPEEAVESSMVAVSVS